jgi:hypothetical protein
VCHREPPPGQQLFSTAFPGKERRGRLQSKINPKMTNKRNLQIKIKSPPPKMELINQKVQYLA